MGYLVNCLGSFFFEDLHEEMFLKESQSILPEAILNNKIPRNNLKAYFIISSMVNVLRV